MLRHKNIDRICCLVLALTVLLSVAFVGAAATGVITEDAGIGYETRLFDQSRVHTIDIVMQDWEAFISNAASEEYAACHLVIDGESCRNVAIRGKGNTSLSSVQAYGNDRYSFKVEFDHYQTGSTYHGLDKLSLNNLIQDNTLMKDYFAYTLMNRMGVAAPLCSFVQVNVNGEPWGLYLAVEGVEDAFLRRNYGRDYGELYKPDSMSFGGGRGNGRDFDMDEMAERFGFSFEEGEGEALPFAIPEDGTMPAFPEGFEPSSGESSDASSGMSSSGESSGSRSSAAAASSPVPTETPTSTPAPTATPTATPAADDSSGASAGDSSGASSGDAGGDSSGMPAMPADGTTPTMPAGDAGRASSGMPAMPADGTTPTMPAGDAGRASSGMPAMPADGTMPTMPTATAAPEDVAPAQTGGRSGMPQMNFGGFGGFGSSTDVKLQYTDDDPDSYANIFGNAKTDITTADKKRLIASLKALGEGDPSVVDTEAVIRYMAVHNFLCNDDSYTGIMVHNYYLYEEDGVLAMIPWDYNLAYGTMNGSNATSAVNTDIDTLVSMGGTGDRPMADWITASGEYMAQYRAVYQEFVTAVFDSGWFAEEIDRVIAMISPFVKADANAFCTYETFLTGAETLRQFCLKRAESVRHQLQSNDVRVDASELTLSDMGSMSGMMGGGRGFGQDSRTERTDRGGRSMTPGNAAQSMPAAVPTAAPEAVRAADVTVPDFASGFMPQSANRTGSARDGVIWLAVCTVLLLAALAFARHYRSGR